MNLSHTVKVVGSVVLSAVMAGSMMPVTVFAQNNDENPTEKTETVYSVLNSDGSISDTIVSSWLHDEDGINNIKETLNLTDVKNIKSNEKPSKDGNTYTWNAKGNDVYYEGTATKQLPVSVKLRYELDGQEMSAKDMEGKSGHLKLTISFTNNYSEVKNINGKSIVIHPSYLAGGMLNMSTGNFTNVKCESGKIVNDGTNEMLAFANIPGLNETLKSAGLDKVNNQLGISDDVTVEADVNNFDLGSIMVGMTNEIDLASELGEIGSVSELTDGIDQLMEADDQLIDGSKQLYDGTTQLKEGIAPLSSAYPQIETLTNAFDQLHDGTTTLSTGLNQYTAGVDQLAIVSQNLYSIQTGLNNADSQLNNQETTTKLGKLVAGVTKVNKAISLMNNQLNESKLTQENIQILKDAISESNAEIGKLEEALKNTNADLVKLGGENKDCKGGEIKAAKDALNELGSLKAGLTNVMTGIGADIQGASVEIQTQKQTEITSVQNSIDALQNALNSLSDTEENASARSELQTQINKLTSYKNSLSTSTTLNQYLEDLGKQADNLKEIVNSSSTVLDKVESSYNESVSAVSGLETQLKNTKDSLNKLAEQMGNVDSIGLTSADFDQLNTLKLTVAALADEKEGTPALVQGVTELQTKLGKLSGGVSDLNSGINQLAPGIAQGTSNLSKNSDSLRNGAKALNDGTAQLSASKSKMSELTSGLTKLSDAVDQLNDGAQQLYEGNEQFKSEGLDQLKEKVDLGVGELETLQSVMNEIKAMNKEYASYSGAPEGATVTSRYVFRTKEESSK
ncbi:hypothetical protein [uncultured Holdemanella sp.]|uniref:hypothetical protein n=1 Tax=uncultured Holdemanella sp. TaxID=1763549 RepID=UPI002588D539|nr:hypothetical protein [uncultured Holdemanella sp.]